MNRLNRLLHITIIGGLFLLTIGCPKDSDKLVAQKKSTLTNGYLADMRSQYMTAIKTWNDQNAEEAIKHISNEQLNDKQLDEELTKLKPIELDLTQLVLNMQNVSTNEDSIEAIFNAFNLDIFRSSPSEIKKPANKVIIKPFLDQAVISNTLYSANRIGTLGQSEWQSQFRRALLMIHNGAISGWRLNTADKTVQQKIKSLNASIKPGGSTEDIAPNSEANTKLRVQVMLNSMIERKARLTKPDSIAQFLIKALQAAATLDSKQASPHYLLGLSYWHAGDLDSALTEIELGNNCPDLSWPLIPPQPNAEAPAKEQLKAADLFMRYQPPGTGIKLSSRHLLAATGIWSSPEKPQVVLDMWKRLIMLNGPIGDWATVTCADSMAMYAALQENRSDLLKHKLTTQQLKDWIQPIEQLKTQITHKQQLRISLLAPQEYWKQIQEQIVTRRTVINKSLGVIN